MKERDKLKEQAKALAKAEGQYTSYEQSKLWEKYRKLRNSINNKIGQEELRYKREKFQNSKDNPSLTWNLAKGLLKTLEYL